MQSESARAAVLASLVDVNRVAIFVEDTPVALVKAIRPDLLVKGADYGREAVVGGNIVERYGGKVLLADLVPGHSTTATILRLSEAYVCAAALGMCDRTSKSLSHPRSRGE